MPQEREPYPVELTTRADPEWKFLHDEVVATISSATIPLDEDFFDAE